MDPLYFCEKSKINYRDLEWVSEFSRTQPTKGCVIFLFTKGATMTTLWFIIALLFGYSVYMTVRSWRSNDEIQGTLEIAMGEENEPPYVFLQIDVPPSQLQNGDVVSFRVHKLKPRN